jgi:hypothetical protein
MCLYRLVTISIPESWHDILSSKNPTILSSAVSPELLLCERRAYARSRLRLNRSSCSSGESGGLSGCPLACGGEVGGTSGVSLRLAH